MLNFIMYSLPYLLVHSAICGVAIVRMRQAPTAYLLAAIGGGIGVVSSLVGLLIPYLFTLPRDGNIQNFANMMQIISFLRTIAGVAALGLIATAVFMDREQAPSREPRRSRRKRYDDEDDD